MKILRVIGASTDDERAALADVLAIWEHDGACSAELLGRIPSGRVEIHVASDADVHQLAIIIIEDGIVGFYPLDEPASDITH